MCTSERKCLAWISLHSIGLPYQGCLRDPRWLLDVEVLCCQSLYHRSVYIDLPTKRLTCLQTVSQGSFGYIDLALYSSSDREEMEVYVKRPILRGRSLLMEACIQMKVREWLRDIGFEDGAPDVVQLFRLADKSVCFAMEPIQHAITLDQCLSQFEPDQISAVLVDCLLQLCSMIWYLGGVIGMNHRDLKPSNFLVVQHPEPITKYVVIDLEVIEMASSYSLTLIDFGFSCIGSTETQTAELFLSSVYTAEDPCPKEGRDLFLFLGTLYVDFHTRMPADILHLFEQWLNMPDTPNFTQLLREHPNKEEAKKWLYAISGHEEIRSIPCCPVRIFHDLYALPPQMEVDAEREQGDQT